MLVVILLCAANLIRGGNWLRQDASCARLVAKATFEVMLSRQLMVGEVVEEVFVDRGWFGLGWGATWGSHAPHCWLLHLLLLRSS